MRQKVKILDQIVNIELDGDYYGPTFWENVSSYKWEPDTFSFIRANCTPSTLFMDIGAANGAMTLAAAVMGSAVVAYEPDPIIYKVLEKNIEINPNYVDLIQIRNAAISTESGKIKFSSSSDPQILTEILFRNREFKDTTIESLSLVDEVAKLKLQEKKILMKMDIEGAEFKLLTNKDVVASLRDQNVLLLLAIHPGFNRHYSKSKLNKKISEKMWARDNYQESLKLYSILSDSASIFRTNFNEVRTKQAFAKLVQAGYHEFVIDFSS